MAPGVDLYTAWGLVTLLFVTLFHFKFAEMNFVSTIEAFSSGQQSFYLFLTA